LGVSSVLVCEAVDHRDHDHAGELSGRDAVHEPAQGAFDGRRSLRRKT
jgi:hypothetical protein